MDEISLILSQWSVVEKSIKSLCTMDPIYLLDGSYTNEDFITQIGTMKNMVLKSYTEWLSKTFPLADDSFGGICCRFALKSLWHLINRFMDAWVLISEHELSHKIVHTYFAMLCIPPREAYHFKEVYNVSDLIREIFLCGTMHHLQGMSGDKMFLKEKNERCTIYPTDPTDCPIYDRFDLIELYLEKLAILYSYPVVPDDLYTELIPTLQTLVSDEKELFEPGCDSRPIKYNYEDPRICVCCKFDSMSIGLCDTYELRNKYECTCLLNRTSLFTGSFSEQLYISRATSITRLLLLNKHILPHHLGCNCNKHNALLVKQMCSIKKVFDQSQIS